MRWILIAIGVLFALAAVSGCPRGLKSAPDGAAIDTTADDEGEPVAGRGTHSADAGQSKTERAQSAGSPDAPVEPPPGRLPENWPAELPQYPGSEITAATSRMDDGGLFLALMQRTSDPAQNVLMFYDEKAVAAGLKKKTDLALPVDGGTVVYESDAATLTVEANRAEKEASTHVSLIYKIKPFADAKPLEKP